jgi:nucleotide-binding universal stress UspA family protein
LQAGERAAGSLRRVTMGAGSVEQGVGEERPAAVVCGLDGSDASRSAARVARLLSERLGLRVVLVSVTAPVERPGVSAAPRGQERLAETERREAEGLLRAAAAESGAADAELRVEFGSAAECLLRVAEEEAAAFLVLGSRGRGRMKAALLGSVSSDVAARAACPVVLVPH